MSGWILSINTVKQIIVLDQITNDYSSSKHCKYQMTWMEKVSKLTIIMKTNTLHDLSHRNNHNQNVYIFTASTYTISLNKNLYFKI